MNLDVLAIAAHPDDVEQTCGGTLIRMAEQSPAGMTPTLSSNASTARRAPS